jgi:hypothetical protein
MDVITTVSGDGKVGICDWRIKQDICRSIIGGYTFNNVIDKIYHTNHKNHERNVANFEKADKLKDNARKWNKHKPSSQFHQFFNDLAATLEMPDTPHGLTIFQFPAKKFINYLPEKNQILARQILLGYEPIDVISEPESSKDRIYKQLWFSPYDGYETIEDCIKRGRVNQKHCYQSPESATIWEHLVNSQSYPTYDHCKSSLSVLVRTPEWRNYLANEAFDGAVMLGGGGSPSKDMVLINSFIENRKPATQYVYHVLVDISTFMLQSSSKWLHSRLLTKNHKHSVRLEAVQADLLDLDKCDEERLRRDKNVAWFITAGTIGNVSEMRFFESVNAKAKLGDLLIISADTFDTPPSHEHMLDLKAKYEHKAMLDFIDPSLRMVLSYGFKDGNMDSVSREIEVKVVSGINNGYSDIPESISVELSMRLQNKKIVLLTSTRYKTEAFISVAEMYGWRHVLTVPSPLNKSFVQFMFLRHDL